MGETAMVATPEADAALTELIAQLQAVPAGTVISYGALAARCGRTVRLKDGEIVAHGEAA